MLAFQCRACGFGETKPTKLQKLTQFKVCKKCGSKDTLCAIFKQERETRTCESCEGRHGMATCTYCNGTGKVDKYKPRLNDPIADIEQFIKDCDNL